MTSKKLNSFGAMLGAPQLPEQTTSGFFGYSEEYDGIQLSIREIYAQVREDAEAVKLAHTHIDETDVPYIEGALTEADKALTDSNKLLDDINAIVPQVQENADKAMASAVTATVEATRAKTEADRAEIASNSVVDITDQMKAEVDKAESFANASEASSVKAEQAATTAAKDAADAAAAATKDALIASVSALTNTATTAATTATSAKDAANVSATNAKASEDASKASELAAKASADSAEAFSTKADADAAQVAADKATVAADKLVVANNKAAVETYATNAAASASDAATDANGANQSKVDAAFSSEQAALSAKSAHDSAVEAMYHANQTFVSGGVFTVGAGTEYPNVAGVSRDTLWIARIEPFYDPSATYTYTSGSLSGKFIRQGWHLVYDTPSNEWFIVPMGATSVVSVNGKHGEVVLNATDVGALKATDSAVGVVSADRRTEGELTPAATQPSAGFSVAFNTKPDVGLGLGGYCGTMTFRPYGNSTDFSGGALTQLGFGGSKSLAVREGGSSGWSGWSKVYTEANKPTAVEVGAIPSTELQPIKDSITANTAKIENLTATDVGAVPTSMISTTGGWANVQNKVVNVRNDGVASIGKYLDFYEQDDSPTDYQRITRTGTSIDVQSTLLERGQRVYSPNNKPPVPAATSSTFGGFKYTFSNGTLNLFTR